MSDYSEPVRHNSLALYVASSILGTMLLLSALRAILGMDLVGYIIDFITSIPDGLVTHTDYWKDVFDEAT